MFTKEDLAQIQEKGIDLKTIEKQIENFKKGFPFVELIMPATIENGISKLRKPDLKLLSEIYNKESAKYKILKFVPASGAASRMFKDLIAFRNNLYDTTTIPSAELTEEIRIFFENITKFAFYHELKLLLAKDGFNIERLLSENNYLVILDYLLTEKGLNYEQLPKALLNFHKYGEESRKAFEEHLIEGLAYCADKDNKVNLHFTLPDEHFDNVLSEAEKIKKKYQEQFNAEFDLQFSVQKPSTDIIAVDLNNNPFRDKNCRLVFRPGGHGSLLANLNDCDCDIIFIKNIDNIVPDRLKTNANLYKKALGGMIIELHQKLSQYLEMLESNELGEDNIKEIEEFAEKFLNLKIDNYFKKYSRINKINYLYFLLNRPLRICGMVRNTGEPGGGPFWVKESSGAVTLQIVEASQVNPDSKEQLKIFKHSTHFNPVDLVCCVRDYKGNKFDLNEYIDESTGFISIKYKDGKELKAQELPGLWNGAMSDWITLFVEVPLTTFTPVKTVNDLLRAEHQEQMDD